MKIIKQFYRKLFAVPVTGHRYVRSEIPPHLHKMPQKEQDEWSEYLEWKAREAARPKIYEHNFLFEEWKRENKR